MKQMHSNIAMPTSAIPKLLNKWIDESMPVDIVVKRKIRRGRRIVSFNVSGTTQADVLAKIEALEALINR